MSTCPVWPACPGSEPASWHSFKRRKLLQPCSHPCPQFAAGRPLRLSQREDSTEKVRMTRFPCTDTRDGPEVWWGPAWEASPADFPVGDRPHNPQRPPGWGAGPGPGLRVAGLWPGRICVIVVSERVTPRGDSWAGGPRRSLTDPRGPLASLSLASCLWGFPSGFC